MHQMIIDKVSTLIDNFKYNNVWEELSKKVSIMTPFLSI